MHNGGDIRSQTKAARLFFDSLTPDQRWELGDDLVLFGSSDLLYEGVEGVRVGRLFMRELDGLLTEWEDTQS